MDSTRKSNFLQQAQDEIYDQISNEHFGVSELAEAVNMSRSNLLRKIKKETGLSASQFIRQIRLAKAKELLEDTELSISEISYEVGFANTSYFTKCFREDYGFPPGEVRKLSIEPEAQEESTTIPLKQDVPEFNDVSEHDLKESFWSKHQNKIIITFTIVSIAVISFYVGNIRQNTTDSSFEKKSLAVLPFKNLSADSSNLYFVNGLMESSLNNLQKIEDLRVVSRTSVEKFKNTDKSISEIAKDLNVTYIVEGSGQKIGDEVLLNIQLIDTEIDTPIWTEQYNHKLEDVFEIQNTVAKQIAMAIKAEITPEELAQINKLPTDDIEAYDYYLQGLELMQTKTDDDYLKAISFFDKALTEDSKFAMAYAQKAIAYYYLDEFKIDKKFKSQLNESADNALLYDSKSDLSLIAKALYYVSTFDFKLAIPYLEKALEYNPNSAPVVLVLSELYARAVPDTSKYLKYALMGVNLNIEANDSISKSFIYLGLSNALAQNGFIDEALENINLSLDYNNNNPYAPYLKLFIEHAKHKDLARTTELLTKEWQKDSTRLDILQEIAKLNYFQEKYKDAHHYYAIYNTLKSNAGVDLYRQENLKMAVSYEKMGYTEQAKAFIKVYDDYCASDQSIYKPASIAMKHVYLGEYNQAIEKFNEFAEADNFQYWIILFNEDDPLMKKLQSHPKYEVTLKRIRDKFWRDHEEIKEMLKESNLI